MRPSLTAGPLIIGGGPAGTAAAITLAAAGHPATLIERTRGPTDKVCGDFLSVEAIAMLRALAIEPLALGAVPVTTLRLVHGHRVAATALPFTGMGLSRRTLDEALLRQAVSAGATVLRGHGVRRLEQAGDHYVAASDTLGPLAARSVFLATGKHDLRGLLRPGRGAPLVGLKMYYRLAPGQRAELGHSTELILFRGGYGGLQPVEQERTVFCVLLPASRLRATGPHWAELIGSLAAEAPHLRQRLAGATAEAARPFAIAGIPYGHLHAAHGTPPGLFRLGDQACVIPSLAGDGIAIALHCGRMAAAGWIAGGDAGDYHRRLAGDLRMRLRLAGALHAGFRAPPLQPAIAAACRAWPGLMRLAASATRLPDAASGPAHPPG
jgi:flavin-dependent dehydrogenase